EQRIAAKPKWTPCQPSDERPQQRALHNGTFSREPICPRDPGHLGIPQRDIDADKWRHGARWYERSRFVAGYHTCRENSCHPPNDPSSTDSIWATPDTYQTEAF